MAPGTVRSRRHARAVTNLVARRAAAYECGEAFEVEGEAGAVVGPAAREEGGR